MRKFFKKDISCKKDLSMLLSELDSRWRVIMDIRDSRKRGKEILKFRTAIKNLLNEYRKNKNSNMDRSVALELIRLLNNNGEKKQCLERIN